ncbi:Longitudinals lacking protein-like, partial [Caligus rogercresseyi]
SLIRNRFQWPPAPTFSKGFFHLLLLLLTELNEKLNDEINRLIKKTSEGLYQCIPCKKTTKRLQNLQFHVESLHVIRMDS